MHALVSLRHQVIYINIDYRRLSAINRIGDYRRLILYRRSAAAAAKLSESNGQLHAAEYRYLFNLTICKKCSGPG